MKKKGSSAGVWLIEVLLVIVILFILVGISIFLIGNIVQKSKVVSAKAQIAQLALLLEEVCDDTGFYPVYLSDLTSEFPPKLQKKGWNGPYVRTLPLDPWGSPYFYKISPTTLFISPPIPRVPGTPDTYTMNFEANPGKGVLRIENYGVTSCDITLNGVIVVHESELKNNPRPQIIEKEVDLIERNNFIMWARSTPGDFLIANISTNNMPTSDYFILGSYGKDKQEKGSGFGKDIVWHSKIYPHFQEDGIVK